MKKYLSLMVAFAMIINLMSPAIAATSGKTYKVSVSKSSGGTVEGSGSYKEGEEVTLIAEAKNGYVFNGWSKLKGVEVEDLTEPEISFEMPYNKVSIKANFKKIQTYKVSVGKSSGGTVDGGGSYKVGELVTLIAEAKSGYEFTGWTQIKGVEIDYIDSEEIRF